MGKEYIQKPIINYQEVDKKLLIINFIAAIAYFSWWLDLNHISNVYLYFLLFFGEIYHVFMAMTFWFTVWPAKKNNLKYIQNFQFPNVDVFITVAGEPVGIVKQTVEAVRDMDYPNHKVYILNDGLVANKDNWKEIELLAKEAKVNCITRKTPGGAKAGNVNNALKQTNGEIVTIFDADMVPHSNFLKKIIPYFSDKRIGFVQSPQYYRNWYINEIASGAWEQQELFFGPIMRGKEKNNSSFICGTNFAIRRKAIEEVGGMQEDNIAEDFYTSLLVHKNKWNSIYVPDVLSEGLAPEDMLSYYKQQLRWARGSLQILFNQNPIFKKGLKWQQKIEYLSSALYYFNGLIVLVDIIMPLIFLYFGIRPVAASSTSFSLFFLPFMFLNLYTLRTASKGHVTFRAISLSYSSWVLQIKALISILLHQKMGFSITPKQALSGNFMKLAYPHMVYIALAIIGTVLAINREGINASVVTNIAWIIVNSSMFIPFIGAVVKPKIVVGEFLKWEWATP